MSQGFKQFLLELANIALEEELEKQEELKKHIYDYVIFYYAQQQQQNVLFLLDKI